MDADRNIKAIEICTNHQRVRRANENTLRKSYGFIFPFPTFQLLQDGEADLHCRSDLYLIDELKLEIYGKL